MKKLIGLLAGTGDWLISLSDRARKQLVIGFLLLLFGGSLYKLFGSLQRLNQPLPAASPKQLLKPMQQLVKQTQGRLSVAQESHNDDLRRLDSLAKNYSDKKRKHP